MRPGRVHDQCASVHLINFCRSNSGSLGGCGNKVLPQDGTQVQLSEGVFAEGLSQDDLTRVCFSALPFTAAWWYRGQRSWDLAWHSPRSVSNIRYGRMRSALAWRAGAGQLRGRSGCSEKTSSHLSLFASPLAAGSQILNLLLLHDIVEDWACSRCHAVSSLRRNRIVASAPGRVGRHEYGWRRYQAHWCGMRWRQAVYWHLVSAPSAPLGSFLFASRDDVIIMPTSTQSCIVKHYV